MKRLLSTRKDRETAKLIRRLEAMTNEIKAVSEAIELADRCFNEVDDSDLTEALIYDRSALLARYSYLIKEVKKLEGEIASAKDFFNSHKNA